MSTQDLGYVRVIDPRLDINSSRQKTYGIYAGAPKHTGRPLPSNNFSNSQIIWNATPPSKHTYVSRRFLATVQFQINFTGVSLGAGIPLLQCFGAKTSPGVLAGNFNYDAPRCMPLSQAIQTGSVSLNGTAFTSNLNNFSRVFQRFMRNEFQEDGFFSYSPSMPDQSQTYAELNGFVRNPLGGYGDNVSQCPRGGFSDFTILTNTSTGIADTASVLLTVTEAIPISPLSFDADQEQLAFIGLETIDVNLQLGGRGVGALTGLAQSIWSHSTLGSALTSATANVLSANLLFDYLTPSAFQQLPPLVTYSFNKLTNYPTTNNAALAPGASTTLVMNSITPPAVGNGVYVFVAPQNSQTDITDTDTFCMITNVNITYDNQDGILSNYSTQMLFEMNEENGFNCSWTQATSKTGMPLFIKFGKDIPLGDLLAPGSRAAKSFQITVTCTNIHPTKTFIPTLNCLMVLEGIVTIDNGSVSENIGVVDEKQVMDSWDTAPIPAKRSKNIYGAALGMGFWDDMLTFGKRVGRAGINVAKSLAPQQFQPIVGEADKLAASYGFGIRDVSKRRGGALLM